MNRFPDVLIVILICGTLLMCSFSALPGFGGSKNKTPTIVPSLQELKSGDLIFRKSRGVMSELFRKLSIKDPRYSHAGVIHIEEGEMYVYHVIGGEENVSNKMVKETMQSFCNPSRVQEFGIYRMQNMGPAIDSAAGNYFLSGLEFDTKFELATDDRMYCTELIYKIINNLRGENYLSLTEVSGKKYVACDDLYLHKSSKQIFSHDYSAKR